MWWASAEVNNRRAQLEELKLLALWAKLYRTSPRV